jgi:hypothetical protein
MKTLVGGVNSFIRCRTSHNAILRGCQALIYRNVWKSERWMTSCSRTCWWRQEHQCSWPSSNVGTLEDMIGNHTVVSWMKSRFMLFLFSSVEQWICCMILFCDMLYVLQCSAFYYLLIVVTVVQHPMYHQTCPTVM